MQKTTIWIIIKKIIFTIYYHTMTTKQKFLQEWGNERLVNENEQPKTGKKYASRLANTLNEEIWYNDENGEHKISIQNNSLNDAEEARVNFIDKIDGIPLRRIEWIDNAYARTYRRKTLKEDTNVLSHIRVVQSLIGISTPEAEKVIDQVFEEVIKTWEKWKMDAFWRSIKRREEDKHIRMREQMIELWASPTYILEWLAWCFGEKAMKLREKLYHQIVNVWNEKEIYLLRSYKWSENKEVMEYRKHILEKSINKKKGQYIPDLSWHVIDSLIGIDSEEARKMREIYLSIHPKKENVFEIPCMIAWLSWEKAKKYRDQLINDFKNNPTDTNMFRILTSLEGIHPIYTQEIFNEIEDLVNKNKELQNNRWRFKAWEGSSIPNTKETTKKEAKHYFIPTEEEILQ